MLLAYSQVRHFLWVVVQMHAMFCRKRPIGRGYLYDYNLWSMHLNNGVRAQEVDKFEES
jgi:hypothetical protein